MTRFPIALVLSAASATLLSQAAPSGAVFSFQVGTFGHYGVALAVDAQGNSYSAGSTTTFSSVPFPITDNVVQTRQASMWIAKVDARGDRIMWATYLGGQHKRNSYSSGPLDYPAAVTMDAEGNVAVVGYMSDTDFPDA